MQDGVPDALATLYAAPLDRFVEERKRLSAELKTRGDKAAAAALSKRGRPSVSAWAVNQLWWRERNNMEQLFASADRVRAGDREAAAQHRELLASLRARAATLLSESGHATPDATLRRVTMTLHALAAAGGFEPDAPGTLTTDRDPPGFEAWTSTSSADEPSRVHVRTPEAPRTDDAKTRQRERAEKQRAEDEARAERKRAHEAAEAERRRQEAERAARAAERKKLRDRVAELERELKAGEREATRLREELAALESRLTSRTNELTQIRARLESDV